MTGNGSKLKGKTQKWNARPGRLTAVLGATALVVYPAALKLVKAFTVTSGRPNPLEAAIVVAPDLLFGLLTAAVLYALQRLLSRARSGPVVCWSVSTLTLAIVLGLSALEHQVWVKTASLLDWGILSYTIRHYDELAVVIASESSAGGTALLISAGVVALVPMLADMAFGRRLRAPLPSRRLALRASGLLLPLLVTGSALSPRTPELVPISHAAAFGLLAGAVSSTQRNLAVASDHYTPSPDLSRKRIERQLDAAALRIDRPARAPKNVLLFILESTRFDATTLYVPTLPTTPRLARMAQHGMVVESAYVDMPHTSKAIISVLCGTAPRWSVEINEAEVGGVPSACAAHVLGRLGYRTAFFQSAWGTFESRRQLVENTGYETFVARESLRESSFAEVNYLALEDKAMVEPILKFVDQGKGKPFFGTVLTCGSHHGYGLPPGFRSERLARFRRNGGPWPTPYEDFDRYLNTVRYVDEFIGEVARGLAQRGVLDDTLIVVVGDHGQGFMEHGQKYHNENIYEEGLRVPLLFHNERLFAEPKRLTGLRRHVDIVPTVLDLIGVKLTGELFEGQNMLATGGHPRIYGTCWYDDRCAVEYDGTLKLIDHYANKPMELFNLGSDPFEQRNLLSTGSEKDRKRYQVYAVAAKERIAAERARIESRYRAASQEDRSYLLKAEPTPAHRVPARLGNYLELIGYDSPNHEVEPGSIWEAVVYFRCLRPSEPGWRLFGRFEAVDHRRQQIDYNPANGRFVLTQCKAGTLIADRFRMWIPEDFPPGPLDFYWGSVFMQEKGFVRRGNDRLGERSVIALERGVLVRDDGVRLARLTIKPQYRDDLKAALKAAVTGKSPRTTGESLEVRLGDGLVLEEASIEPTTVRRASSVRIVTTWRVEDEVKGPWQLFAHVDVPNREEQKWHTPVDGLHPITNWKAGTWVRDTFTFALPGWLDAGAKADVWIGVGYERKRLKIRDSGRATTDTRKRVRVGTITVTR